jgi:hypothetical protein
LGVDPGTSVPGFPVPPLRGWSTVDPRVNHCKQIQPTANQSYKSNLRVNQCNSIDEWHFVQSMLMVLRSVSAKPALSAHATRLGM